MPHPSHHTQLPRQEQLSELLNLSWHQDIVPLLPPEYEQAAHQLGAYQRSRGLHSVADLLRALLAFVLCTSSLRHLGAWAVVVQLADISHVAWHKRIQRARDWLCWLLIQVLSLPTTPPATFGQGCRRVVLVDATRLKQPGGCGDDWRAHLAYDLLQARLVDVHVSDQHTAEGFTLFSWQPGDLVVADRGYCRRSQVGWLREQGAHVLVRLAVKQFPLLDAQGRPLDVLVWLRPKARGRFERVVSFEQGGHRYQGRVIAQSLTPQAAEQARARVRRRASKKQYAVQEDTVFLAGWLIVLTSLPKHEWSMAQVLGLYRARWQIELVIKRMKQVLKLAQLRGKTPQSNEACLFALLLAWALQQTQVDQARQVIAQTRAMLDEAEPFVAQTLIVSSWALHTLSIQTLRLQVQGYWTSAQLHACWPRLRRFVCSRRRRRLQQEGTIRRKLCEQLGWDVSSLFNCSSALS